MHTRFGRHEPDPEDASVLRIAEAIHPDRFTVSAAEFSRHRDIRKRIDPRRSRDVDHHFDKVIRVNNRRRLAEDNFCRFVPRRDILSHEPS